jgi:hypothetical protein
MAHQTFDRAAFDVQFAAFLDDDDLSPDDGDGFTLIAAFAVVRAVAAFMRAYPVPDDLLLELLLRQFPGLTAPERATLQRALSDAVGVELHLPN